MVQRELSATALIEKIDAELPQTQCEQCGFQGCYAYATAVASGEAEYNRCPPGGEPVLKALAKVLDRELIPLDLTCGEYKTPQVAYVDESLCIGCAKCLIACPVDAIVGTRRMMHQIIESECTGCELCIPPCPLDCIEIKKLPNKIDLSEQIGLTEAQRKRADYSRERFNARKAREAKRETITKTTPPAEELELADPVSSHEMLSLIDMARQKFNDK